MPTVLARFSRETDDVMILDINGEKRSFQIDDKEQAEIFVEQLLPLSGLPKSSFIAEMNNNHCSYVFYYDAQLLEEKNAIKCADDINLRWRNSLLDDCDENATSPLNKTAQSKISRRFVDGITFKAANPNSCWEIHVRRTPENSSYISKRFFNITDLKNYLLDPGMLKKYDDYDYRYYSLIQFPFFGETSKYADSGFWPIFEKHLRVSSLKYHCAKSIFENNLDSSVLDGDSLKHLQKYNFEKFENKNFGEKYGTNKLK